MPRDKTNYVKMYILVEMSIPTDVQAQQCKGVTAAIDTAGKDRGVGRAFSFSSASIVKVSPPPPESYFCSEK